MNTCDKCKKEEPSEELIWITADDFKPYKGEILPKDAYKKYDALCQQCYWKILIK